ncbi:MAG TPA: hypothetical protein VD790_10440 [Thermoleophilaceae bacterium]|nr:hypothetical protein [Thermoleophilaceae bacterium]
MNHELSKRVRRAARKWPITELDPIELNAFTDAVAVAESFEDLEPEWQRLIEEAEAGPKRLDSVEFFLHLRGAKPSGAR